MIQATVGCPHNKCTFCVVYKKGPRYRARPVAYICKDIGMELSAYALLGLGGSAHSREHALHTAEAVNAISPDFVRLRTLVPKIDTLMLHQIDQALTWDEDRFRPAFIGTQ